MNASDSLDYLNQPNLKITFYLYQTKMILRLERMEATVTIKLSVRLDCQGTNVEILILETVYLTTMLMMLPLQRQKQNQYNQLHHQYHYLKRSHFRLIAVQIIRIRISNLLQIQITMTIR